MENIDFRINMIVNKIKDLGSSIVSLNEQKKNIMFELENSYNLDEREIYFNNLHLLNSLCGFYSNQKIFLEKKYLEYFSIINDIDKVKSSFFLNVWRKEIDLFFSESNLFSFNSPNREFSTNNKISIDFLLNKELFNDDLEKPYIKVK